MLKPFCLQKQIYYWRNNHLVLNLRTPSTNTTWTPRTKRGRHLRTSCPKAGAMPPSEMCVCVCVCVCPHPPPIQGSLPAACGLSQRPLAWLPPRLLNSPSIHISHLFHPSSSLFSPLLSFVMSVQLFPLHCPLSSWLSLLPLCQLSIFPSWGSFFFLPDSFFIPLFIWNVSLHLSIFSLSIKTFHLLFLLGILIHSALSTLFPPTHFCSFFLSLLLCILLFLFIFVLFLKHVSYLAVPLFNFLSGVFLIIICLSAALRSIRSWSPQWTLCAIIIWSRLWCPLSSLCSWQVQWGQERLQWPRMSCRAWTQSRGPCSPSTCPHRWWETLLVLVIRWILISAEALDKSQGWSKK